MPAPLPPLPTPQPPGFPQGHVPELDGLRAVAVVAVVLHHTWRGGVGGWLATGLWNVTDFCWAGVDVFFALSGFLITRILLKSRESPAYYRSFYARRALRILPLYALVVAALLVLGPVLGAMGVLRDPDLSRIAPPWIYAAFLSNFWIAAHGFGWRPLDVSWSLAVEEQFYVAWAPVVRRVPPERLLRPLLLVLLWSPLIRLAVALFDTAIGKETYVPMYVLPFCRLDALGYGAGVALLAHLGRRQTLERAASAAGPLVLASLLAAVSGWMDRTDTRVLTAGYALVPLTTACVIAAVLVGRFRGATGLLRWSPLQWVGKVSYGIYLLHPAVDSLLRFGPWPAGLLPVGPSLTGAAGASGLVLAISIGLASLSWVAFERPILAAKVRFEA